MSVPPQFAPVTRRTLPEEVRDALVASIHDGSLAPGAVLPSERALSDQFAVARTSVREAIQSLLSLGHIHKQGNRFYVVERLPDIAVSGADNRKRKVRELFEVRRLMEVGIARLAVERADDDDLADLQAVCDSFSEKMPLDRFRQQDRVFHWTIARLNANPTLLELYGKVLDAVFGSEEFRSLLDAHSNARAVRRVIAESVRGHQLITCALVNRDAAAAAEAVAAHIAVVEAHMVSQMV